MNSRQIVLDTETTGLEVKNGHRIIEIGCVCLDGRQLSEDTFHCYINPQRNIDKSAYEVHGISNKQLKDKPKFADIAQQLIDFLKGSELIIHNVSFDIGFLNYELDKAGFKESISDICPTIHDSLELARKRSSGGGNSLDELCRYYGFDLSSRQKHGALIDAQLLAKVWLKLTSGQEKLALGSAASEQQFRYPAKGKRPRVIQPRDDELKLHQKMMAFIKKHLK